MSRIATMVQFLRACWREPKEAAHRGHRTSLPLACTFASEPADAATIDHLMPAIPDDVRAFWLIARSASLFKDQQYGQWGIEILDPQGAIEETNRQILSRPQDFHAQDLVLATFLGDSDLLVISCEAGRAEFGSVLVARPLDPRQDW